MTSPSPAPITIIPAPLTSARQVVAAVAEIRREADQAGEFLPGYVVRGLAQIERAAARKEAA